MKCPSLEVALAAKLVPVLLVSPSDPAAIVETLVSLDVASLKVQRVVPSSRAPPIHDGGTYKKRHTSSLPRMLIDAFANRF